MSKLFNKGNLDKAEKAYIDFEQEYSKLWGNVLKTSYGPGPTGIFVKNPEELFRVMDLKYDDKIDYKN